MNRLKIKYAVAYGFLAATAVALIASLFAGCHVYEHEEVEIIRCPVIEADTIDIPGTAARKAGIPTLSALGIRTERANSSLSWIGIWEPSVRI